MNVAARLFSSLREGGLGVTLVKAWSAGADYVFDLKYGVETCSWSELDGLSIGGENKRSGYAYRPTRVLPLRRLFRALQPMFRPESVLVDIGCGKGRILLVASEFGFRVVRGVEFAHELCQIARKNVARYKARTKAVTEFDIIEADATQRQIQADEDVFIMYNPFDDTVLAKVLDNIALSISQSPRKVVIVYYNPRWASVFQRRSEFIPLRDFDFWSFKFSVYSSRDSDPA